MREGLLYWKVWHCNMDECTFQFVLPHALKGCHNDIRHLETELFSSTKGQILLAHNGMAKDMENHVRQYDRCLHFKQKLHKAELNPTWTTHPMEIVHIDYLTIKSGKSNKDVKILGCHRPFHPKQLRLLLKDNHRNITVISKKPSFRPVIKFWKLVTELCQLAFTKKLKTTTSVKKFNVLGSLLHVEHK